MVQDWNRIVSNGIHLELNCNLVAFSKDKFNKQEYLDAVVKRIINKISL